MKKIILPIFAITLLSLASCRKDRTCECSTVVTTNGTGESSNSSQTVGHAKKREAKRLTDCYSYKETETETIMGTVYTKETVNDCKLK